MKTEVVKVGKPELDMDGDGLKYIFTVTDRQGRKTTLSFNAEAANQAMAAFGACDRAVGDLSKAMKDATAQLAEIPELVNQAVKKAVAEIPPEAWRRGSPDPAVETTEASMPKTVEGAESEVIDERHPARESLRTTNSIVAKRHRELQELPE
jgi:hypothetical protein